MEIFCICETLNTFCLECKKRTMTVRDLSQFWRYTKAMLLHQSIGGGGSGSPIPHEEVIEIRKEITKQVIGEYISKFETDSNRVYTPEDILDWLTEESSGGGGGKSPGIFEGGGQ